MPNGSKYHHTEGNIHLIEWRPGGEAGGSSGLEGRRSHKAEGAIGRMSGSCHIYSEAFRKLRRKRVFRYREERRIWRFEEPDAYRERGVAIERTARPLHDRQKWTELDFGAISEYSRTDHTVIE
jgi:hypothetical protein